MVQPGGKLKKTLKKIAIFLGIIILGPFVIGMLTDMDLYVTVVLLGLIAVIFIVRRLVRYGKSLKNSQGDEALMRLEGLRFKSFMWRLAIMLFVAGSVVLFVVSEFAEIFGLVFVFDTLLAIFGWNRFRDKYNESFKQDIVAGELQKAFKNVRYDPKKTFSNSEVNRLNLFPRVDQCIGNDMLEAEYEDVYFAQADIMMERSTKRIDSQGNTNVGNKETFVRMFTGRMMRFDYPNQFKGDIQILSDDFSNAHLSRISKKDHGEWKNIETESEEFNRDFNVFTKDASTAFEVLTPQMIEGIVYLRRSVAKPIALCYSRNLMYIFITKNDGDAFDISVKRNVQEEVAKVTADIKMITDILENMYFKRQ